MGCSSTGVIRRIIFSVWRRLFSLRLSRSRIRLTLRNFHEEALMSLKQLFTEHPDAVGESYFEHMSVALSFAGPLAVAAMAALIHAFLPFLCVTTASATVKRLYARMTNRMPRPARQTANDGMLAWDPVI